MGCGCSSCRKAALKRGPAACQQLLSPASDTQHHLGVRELLQQEHPELFGGVADVLIFAFFGKQTVNGLRFSI